MYRKGPDGQNIRPQSSACFSILERYIDKNYLSKRCVTDYSMASHSQTPAPQIQPCRYKTGKTLGAGSYSVVKECVHIDTGRYYAAKVINKKMMAGREHMVCPQADFN